ncbi:MAG: hypothetical protein Ct9H300mP7_6150 [Verrucomicrobiota bacterium]|nr:MAG: hypothetical protein Ct9H300mP7_6150 [Verrucomicrobiota bacterium]
MARFFDWFKLFFWFFRTRFCRHALKRIGVNWTVKHCNSNSYPSRKQQRRADQSQIPQRQQGYPRETRGPGPKKRSTRQTVPLGGFIGKKSHPEIQVAPPALGQETNHHPSRKVELGESRLRRPRWAAQQARPPRRARNGRRLAKRNWLPNLFLVSLPSAPATPPHLSPARSVTLRSGSFLMTGCTWRNPGSGGASSGPFRPRPACCLHRAQPRHPRVGKPTSPGKSSITCQPVA